MKDKESGLFTLGFTNSKKKRYKATMEKFKIYSKLSPVICRELGADQVLGSFHMRATGLSTANDNTEIHQLIKEMPAIRSSIVSKIGYML